MLLRRLDASGDDLQELADELREAIPEESRGLDVVNLIRIGAEEMQKAQAVVSGLKPPQ